MLKERYGDDVSARDRVSVTAMWDGLVKLARQRCHGVGNNGAMVAAALAAVALVAMWRMADAVSAEFYQGRIVDRPHCKQVTKRRTSYP